MDSFQQFHWKYRYKNSKNVFSKEIAISREEDWLRIQVSWIFIVRACNVFFYQDQGCWRCAGIYSRQVSIQYMLLISRKSFPKLCLGFGVVGEYFGWWDHFRPLTDRWLIAKLRMRQAVKDLPYMWHYNWITWSLKDNDIEGLFHQWLSGIRMAMFYHHLLGIIQLIWWRWSRKTTRPRGEQLIW